MDLISKSLNLLGRKARDKVTGFEGVIHSIGFDAYGCVQAIVNPPMKDGKLLDQAWFDIKRLELFEAVMEPPDFGQVAFGKEPGADLHKPTR
ncbi:MAG TPA: hypothetical protein VGL34_10830, partial [Steroidobacteraceae bacterium]